MPPPRKKKCLIFRRQSGKVKGKNVQDVCAVPAQEWNLWGVLSVLVQRQ